MKTEQCKKNKEKPPPHREMKPPLRDVNSLRFKSFMCMCICMTFAQLRRGLLHAAADGVWTAHPVRPAWRPVPQKCAQPSQRARRQLANSGGGQGFKRWIDMYIQYVACMMLFAFWCVLYVCTLHQSVILYAHMCSAAQRSWATLFAYKYIIN